MTRQHIPPHESHPLYYEWWQASIRNLKTEQRLQAMSHIPETDPEFAAAYREWRTAKMDYETLCSRLISPAEIPVG